MTTDVPLVLWLFVVNLGLVFGAGVARAAHRGAEMAGATPGLASAVGRCRGSPG